MQTVFDLLLNAIIIASFIGFLVILFVLVFKTTTSISELFVRTLAVFAGALVVLGARATDLSYAEYMIDALSGVRPVTPFVEGVLTLSPGFLGVAVGWYITRLLSRDDPKAIRVIAFVGMLAVASFFNAYTLAFEANGLALGKLALPNVSFVIGLVLWIIIKYPAPGDVHRGARVSDTIRASVRRAAEASREKTD